MAEISLDVRPENVPPAAPTGGTFRASAFGFLSDLGFRTSGLPAPLFVPSAPFRGHPPFSILNPRPIPCVPRLPRLLRFKAGICRKKAQSAQG
jgi:hypothetical protein